MELRAMPLTPRSGFTLVDTLIAMVLFGIIGTVATRTVLGMERTLRGARDRAATERAFESALMFFSSELSDAGPGDLLVTAPDSLTYRAVRASGLACRVGTSEIRLLADRFSVPRRLQAGRDSLLLHGNSDTLSSHGRGWLAVPILSVGSATCDGRAAISVGTVLDTAVWARPATPDALVPVRSFEVMQVRLYQSLGGWWIGARSVSTGETIQPLAGPFENPGSGFAYLDSTHSSTPTAEAVRSLRLTLSSRGAGWNGASGTYQDSATLSLEPRNLQR